MQALCAGRWLLAIAKLTVMRTSQHALRKFAICPIVPVSYTQGCLDGCLDLAGLTLPGSQAQHWHLLAVVQSHIRVFDGAVLAAGGHRV